MDHLLLSRMADGQPEVFASIQGEGASAGRPSTFIRLAVCNLRCAWCDTAYTWDWSRYRKEEQVLSMTAADLLPIVTALPPRNAVITGGEPLLQRPALLPFVQRLKDAGFRIEVETNGTVPPGDLGPLVDQWNVSPKLQHSGNEGLTRIRPDVLKDFASRPNAFLKLVVHAPEDLPEVDALVVAHGFPPDRVLLMPEGRTGAELAERSPWLAEACTARGFRFSTRLHILIWGDKRGV